MSRNNLVVESGEVADVHLEITDTAVLSAELIDTVNEICDRVVERGEDTLVGVRLHGSAGGPPDRPWPGGVDVHLVSRWERALRRLERLDALTFGLAEGSCHGGAVELLLATDYRVAAPDLRLRLGARPGEAWPGMLVYRLAHQLGLTQARSLVLFGADLSAAKACELGLVTEVADDPVARLQSLGPMLRPVDGREIAIRRQLLADAANTSFEESLGAHLAACDRTLRRPVRNPRGIAT